VGQHTGGNESNDCGEERKQGGKTELEWAWEIHKNCDHLLHQRLAAFTAAQAMTLAAFTLLTVARFNVDPDKIPIARINLLEAARVLVLLLGLATALLGMFVAKPMFRRLEYLNDNFLYKIPVYHAYREAAVGARLRWYKNIIPVHLPAIEIGFWVLLLMLLVSGILHGR
jgi:hypothetical protein